MSAVAAPADPDIPAKRLAELPDFSERLSPMLVKELRQGMRSPVFVWGLIVMNLGLTAIVSLNMLDPDADYLHQAFFGVYCLLVCGLLPLRAAGALHDELRGNTIDTLVLTRLSGWRITTGKWVAVVAQQVLAAITVLPYVIVRYFAGGIDVPMELAWLGIFLLTGMLSAAVLTGFSWMRYFLFRAAMMMGVTWLTVKFCVEVLEDLYGSRRDNLLEELYDDGGWRVFAMLFIGAAHLAFFCLDLGAARVSALVETKALRRRLVATGVIALYLLGGLTLPWQGSFPDLDPLVMTVKMVCGTLALTGLQAILERPVNLMSVVLPWVRRGTKGRIAGRFLYDGWPSGVCWFGGMLLVGTLLLGWRLEQIASEAYSGMGHGDYYLSPWEAREVAAWVTTAGGFLGMLIAPLVLWRWWARDRLPWHLGTWLVFVVGLGMAQLAVFALASTTENNQMLKWGLPLPGMGLSWVTEANDYRRSWRSVETYVNLNWDYLDIIRVSGLVVQGWWLAAGWCALRAFRKTTALEQEAMAALKSGTSPSRPVAGRGDPAELVAG